MAHNKQKSERLTVLSELEEFAFYGFPDFDDEQRLTYFAFEDNEWEVVTKCPTLSAQVACALQIGYFKAKQAFFPLHKVPKSDLDFILSRYFPNQAINDISVTRHTYYLQREAICKQFGYTSWSSHLLPLLKNRAKLSVKRDISPHFIAHELLDFLQTQKIVRPGYTTLQTIVSMALSKERQRLKFCLRKHLTDSHKELLKRLIANEHTLSELAALKQDPKNFNATVMRFEIKKHDILKTLYEAIQAFLPHLNISKQNIEHYASLAHHYTIYDLERFEEEQTYLYLLCYTFKRYQQINDNLVEALSFNLKKLEKETKTSATINFANAQASADEQKIGQLLLLYVDDDLKDIHAKAFEIMPKESIRALGEKMVKKPRHKQDFQWQERDKSALQYKHNLRPLLMKIDFTSQLPNNPLLKTIQWMKSIFAKKQALSQQPFASFPHEFISKRLQPYLLTEDDNKNPMINADRFEILVYRQVTKQMETGAIYVQDSLRHRPFAHDLVSLKDKKAILKDLHIPWLETPCKKQLNILFKELESLWIEFNDKLKHEQIKHLKYNAIKKEITWVKPKIANEETISAKQTFYDDLPIVDIVDVLRFVHKQTGFLSAFTPLQPRYKKQEFDEDNVVAVTLSQGLGIGNYKMAHTSDVLYHILESTYQQYVRLPNLRKARDTIANKISQLSIFKYHTFDIQQILYGAVDGQKFEAITPTAKARYSKKYFKKGRGIVAYTLLSNHVPIQSELIGAHEHESYFMFDIWYNNTSSIHPSILTGDMHSVNKANFAILHGFGADFRPRLTNLKDELSHIYGTKDPSQYKKFLVQPKGKIDQQIILDEKDNIDRIVATLALKEISQSILIKKLCSLPSSHKTRKAVFEYNKLIRSIYTLKCILDPQILAYSHRSQNRIESYHTLRATIAKAGGRKALLGRTDLEMEISNQCGVLIAIAIIYYNDFIHSRFLDQNPNKRSLKALKKFSPTAWKHIHFTGHFTFYDHKKKININKIVEKIKS